MTTLRWWEFIGRDETPRILPRSYLRFLLPRDVFFERVDPRLPELRRFFLENSATMRISPATTAISTATPLTVETMSPIMALTACFATFAAMSLAVSMSIG